MAQSAPKIATKTTTMTINLRKRLLRLHAARRRKRALGILTEAVARFSKSDPDSVRVSKELNEFILKKAGGSSFLWAKLKVNVEKTGDKTDVKLYAVKAPEPQQAKAAPNAAKTEKKQEAKPKKEKGKEKETKEPKQQKQA